MRTRLTCIGCALVLAACADSEATGPEPDAATLTVDASTDWVYVDLGPTARVVTPATPSSSTEWDIAFNATRVMLNGGAAGPSDVAGWCVCQNANASDAAVQAMLPETELADFEGVTLANAPSDASAWETDALDAAITGWYTYDIDTHQVSAVTTAAWKVRGAGADPEYAKLRVTGISDATQSGARVTIEYAVQPAAGEPLGAVQTAVLDGRTESVRFDFASGAVVDDGSWDIELDGYDLRVNGGVSGTGGAGAVAATEPFESMTDASDAPANVYRGDAFGGVFVSHPWYRYNLDGNHTIFPTYDVYLIDTPSGLYKLQITSYYSTTGEPHHVTFRYASLES